MPSPFVRERWVQTPNGAELHLFLQNYDYLVEMAGELGDQPEAREEQIERSIRRYIEEKYPNMPIKRVRLFLGSMLITTMSFAGVFGAVGGTGAVQAASAQIGLIVNGTKLQNTNPFLQNGRAMVPVRAISESLGATVGWTEATQTVTIRQGGRTVTLRIGSSSATVDGRTITLDAPPVIVSGTTYVPVRFVSEALGAKVAWDSYRNTVVISSQPAELYTVRSGDTLWKISEAFGVSFASLLQVNGMTNQTGVYPGEQLLVPREGGTTTTPPAPTDTTPAGGTATTDYTVVAGDSLWKIATQFGTTVAALKAANNLTSDMLYVGQRLTVPTGGATAPTTTTPTPTTTTPPAPTTTTPTGQAGEYIVQPGDNLWLLANRYNTTIAAIKTASGITSDALFVGQRLMIPNHTPAPPPPAESYLEGTDARARAQLGQDKYVFPFQNTGSYTPFRDTWGDSREYNPDGSVRTHEGTDIMAPAGTPLVAVGSGTVINYGWSELGGWRVTIKLDGTDYAVYYAHMSRYAPGLYKGARVQTGQLLGYVGSTGYGPAGTSGKFVNHLHFGLYDTANGFSAINPYPFLKYWEAR